MATSASPPNKYSWLITFLIYNNPWYDKKFINDPNYITLEQQKDTLFNAIHDLEFVDTVKIILVEAQVNVLQNDVEVWAVSKTNTTKRFKSERLPEPLMPAPAIPHATNASNILTNATHLTQVLSFVKKNNEADHNMIITIGHGSIFGINLYSEKDDFENPLSPNVKIAFQRQLFDLTHEQKDDLNNQISFKKLIPEIESTKVKLKNKLNAPIDVTLVDKLTKSAEFIDSIKELNEVYQVVLPLNLCVLTVNEIKTSLKEVFLEQPVDILVMDNCLMQNVFTQYELRDCVKYLVAAQSGISYPGFNYSAIIQKIYDNPNIDPKELAGAFVDENVIRAHLKYEKYKYNIETTWCVNAIQLEMNTYENMKERFDSLFQILNDITNSNDKKIKVEIFKIIDSTINQLFSYSSHSMPAVKVIDMNVFLEYFKEKVVSNNVLKEIREELTTKIIKLAETLKTVQSSSFIGNNFYPTRNYYIDYDRKVSIGFGFLLPVKPTRDKFIDMFFIKSGSETNTPEFVANSEYFKFIQKFWEWYPANFV